MTLLEFCQWLETTSVARLVTESRLGFQVLVAAHLLGLTLSVGMIIWMDLRLLDEPWLPSPYPSFTDESHRGPSAVSP